MPAMRNAQFDHMPGVTLFHAARSNCSARVRLLLAEKAIAWKSSLINLRNHENRSPEYFAVNPKGLVPTLIHQGFVITESNDILEYLESGFPGSGFRPDTSVELAAMSRWMQRSAEIHLPGVKTFNYSQRRLVNERPAGGWDRYRLLQRDPELLRFHEKAGGSGFSIDEQESAQRLLTTVLRAMDGTLSTQSWLAGDHYSLADICWAPTIPTLMRAGFDLDPFPRMREWHQRIAQRAAYREAVTKWEEEP